MQNNDNFPYNSTTTVTTDGRDRYTALTPTVGSTVSPTYDAGGNLTYDGTDTLTYDVENRLVARSGAGSTATLRYDPLGRLYEMVGSQSWSGTTRFLYDGDDLLMEYDSSGNIARRYVHGPGTDQPLVWYEGSGFTGPLYFYADERG